MRQDLPLWELSFNFDPSSLTILRNLAIKLLSISHMRAAAMTWMSGGLLHAMPPSLRPCRGHTAVPQLTDLSRFIVPAGCQIPPVFSPLPTRSRCSTSAAAQDGTQTPGRDVGIWAPAAADTATVPAAAEVGVRACGSHKKFLTILASQDLAAAGRNDTAQSG